MQRLIRRALLHWKRQCELQRHSLSKVSSDFMKVWKGKQEELSLTCIESQSMSSSALSWVLNSFTNQENEFSRREAISQLLKQCEQLDMDLVLFTIATPPHQCVRLLWAVWTLLGWIPLLLHLDTRSTSENKIELIPKTTSQCYQYQQVQDPTIARSWTLSFKKWIYYLPVASMPAGFRSRRNVGHPSSSPISIPEQQTENIGRPRRHSGIAKSGISNLPNRCIIAWHDAWEKLSKTKRPTTSSHDGL